MPDAPDAGKSQTWSTRKEILTALALGLLVFLVHAASPNSTSFDSRWTIHTAVSLIEEGNTDLNEFEPALARDGFYLAECVDSRGRSRLLGGADRLCDGRLYHYYPVAVPLLAAPSVAALSTGLRVAGPLLRPLAAGSGSELLRSLLLGDLPGAASIVEVLIASLFMALAAIVIYFTVRDFLDPALAAAVSVAFAFCTPAWSLASRALWMHGPSMLMLAIALLLAVRARHDARLAASIGAVLALSFFVRPTNAISAVVFTLFVFLRYRRQFFRFMLAAAATTIPFAGYSLLTYGSVLAPFSQPNREGMSDFALHNQFFEALAANLISPGRGLFIYVPLALFALYGLLAKRLPPALLDLRWYLAAIIALHLLLISTFEDWIAGHAFGPRYMSDVIPYFVFLAAPAAIRFRDSWRRRRYAWPALTALLVVFSFWIHLQGATNWPCWEWNSLPQDVTAHRERIWDWTDPPFLRGLPMWRRF
jgi:hypothetical protein